MAELKALVFMRRNGEEMNVPEDKVATYLEEGWVEVSRTYQAAPVAMETPVDDKLAPTDTGVANDAPTVDKPKKK